MTPRKSQSRTHTAKEQSIRPPVTDAFGNTQVFHYDEQGRITARQEPDGATYQWEYDDESGLLVAHRLPDGRTTYYGYDAAGRKVIEQLPDGRQHRWHFNTMGFCTGEQIPDGLITRRQFDSVGRLLSEEHPDGSQWRYQYDANGWMTQATSDTGEVRRIGYSPNGEVLADERQGNLHRYTFDPQGRVAGYLQHDLVTEYDYEGAKLLAVHQYPEQAPEQRRSRQFGYNDSGLLTTYTNAVGDIHRYDYAQLARPIAYRRPDGHSVGYDYDLEERLTRVTRADGNQWQLGWYARGKVDRCQAPDGRDIRFHYNEAGEIIRREHPDVWVQTVERDEGGRVTTQTSQGRDRAPVTRHYQYDKYGRRTHASCADRKVRWAWNNKGQVTEHHQDQHATSYSYTTGGNLESMTLPDGTKVQYRYDKHGHWTHLDINGQPAIRRTLGTQGRETERQAGNNKQTQIHDRYGCLIKRRWQGKTPATRRYRWDAESRVEAVIDSQSGETYYERDPQGQLIKENDIIYRYDLGGNRIPDGGKVENDRLIETENEKREYDALGAEIRVIGKTTEARKFDAEGQLIEVKKPGIHVTYGYDALGRRAWRKSEAGTTSYLWHNDVLIGEQNPEGQWQYYIRDPQTDEPLITLVDGQPHYYELDWRMMPIRLWDKDGDLVWQANADAWGYCRPEMPKGHVHQPIRLPGQFEDEVTGIIQNRYREYQAMFGRYLSPDPIALDGGSNSFCYTKNPVDYIDKLGLEQSKITVEDVSAANRSGREDLVGINKLNIWSESNNSVDFDDSSVPAANNTGLDSEVSSSASYEGSASGSSLNLFNPKSLQNLAVSREGIDQPDEFEVFAHGDQYNVFDDVEGDRVPLSAEDLATRIRADEGYTEGMTVRLGSCNTGKGETNIAQELADELNTKVIAPDRYYHPANYSLDNQVRGRWGFPKGDWVVYEPR